MNLKSRLFKKPWQHKDPEVRAQAVHESDDPELKAELTRIAQDDEAAMVRLAALKRINSEPFWLDARLRESDPEIVAAADAFLAREVPRTAGGSMQKERLQWFALINDADLIRRMAISAEDVALRRAAVERINAQGFLGDAFGKETDDQLAAEILARIDQQSTLERLVEGLRKTSKKRSQAAAARLLELQAASGKHDPQQLAADQVVARMEALARGAVEGDRGELLAELLAEWKKLKSPSEAMQRRFDGARKIVEAAINRPARPAAEAEQSDAQPAADQPASDGGLEQAADHIRTAIRQARTDLKPVDLLATWDRAWNQIKQPGPAEQALKADMLPLLRELQAQSAQQSQKKEDGVEEKAESTESGRDFNAELDLIARTLEEGDIRRSHELIRALRSENDKLPTRSRPREVGGRLQRMEGRLKEMRNYQHWSHNKHRDELIEQIEKLPETGQHPDAISVALKEARDEWQRLEKLETLPGDRKRFAAPPGQWRRFQAACKLAFDSAKPYFEKRHEIQQDNLEQLDSFVEQGLSLASSDQPDSKLLQQFMRKARQAIRRLDDLPPRTRGKSAARLRELMDAISRRLDEAFEQIELTKRRLITEARALAHEKDIKVATDKAKALQAQWQQAGSGRRKLEQKLWEEFREPIDPLFEKIKGERQEQKQADKEALAELKSLCEQAETLARIDEAELDNARGRMSGLAADWHARPGRPGNLNSRFEKAEAAFERRLEEARDKERAQARSALENLAGAVQAIWSKRLEKGSKDLLSLVPESQADADQAVAVDLLAAARRFADPDTADDELEEVAAEQVEQARQVVVEAEFLTGMDTPEADRKLRMDYQVKRLAQRMSERSSTPDLETELAMLIERWYKSLPHPPSKHAELAKRFAKCRGVLEKMAGT
jgi:DNA repair protein SbcC/Rad50